MRRLALPDGSNIPVIGQGTWRMGEVACQTPRRSEGAAGRHRSRPHPHRYRGNVWQWRRRGGGGRGHRRAAATEVYLVSKVLPSNASFAGTHRGLRAQPEAPEDRPSRSLSAALARWRTRWPKRCRRSSNSKPGQDQAASASAISTSNDMKQWLALPGTRRPAPRPTRSSTISASADRNVDLAPALAQQRHRPHGLLPAGARRRSRPSPSCNRSPSATMPPWRK